MPAIITRGTSEKYLLEQLDPDSETYVVIKPATVQENALRDELWANQVRTYNANTPAAVEVKGETTFAQRQALEVFLTLVDCNVMYQDMDDEGKAKGDPVLMFSIGKRPGGAPYLAMTREEFLAAWGRLPQTAADEIHAKVLLKNQAWDMFQG
jgi:hypothetical protein